MENHDKELVELVQALIYSRREDDWWDFKECHYEDNATLLHDVICLANNRMNRDAYLILGVRDKTFEIIGVENDLKRKNQQMVTDFLSSISFAGQTRPRVEVRTVLLEGHEIDVFIIKNSSDVPYYLVKNYTEKKDKSRPSKKGKTVRAFHIYTRVMDNNTPIDKSADIRDVEYLWKKRFGLLQTPLEQIKVLLRQPEEWTEENSRYYHKLYPQYTIIIEYEEDENGISKMGAREFYHYLQNDTSTQYGTLKIYHYNTQLFSIQVTALDGYRMTAPCPEWGFIKDRNYEEPNICFKYYVKSSLLYLLLRFLETKIGANNGQEAQIATGKHLEIVLLFEDEGEAEGFKTYVNHHLGRFDELASQQKARSILDPSERVMKIETKRIRDSYVLKAMKEEWIAFQSKNKSE